MASYHRGRGRGNQGGAQGENYAWSAKDLADELTAGARHPVRIEPRTRRAIDGMREYDGIEELERHLQDEESRLSALRRMRSS